MGLTKDLDYIEEYESGLFNLVINNSKDFPIKDLAKIVGRSPSLVYKAADPNSDYPFPAIWRPAFMNIKNDYSTLELDSMLTGHLPPVKMPIYKIIKKDEQKFAIEVQKRISDLGILFQEFLATPTEEKQKEFKKKSMAAIKEILSAIHYSEKAVKAQGELEYE